MSQYRVVDDNFHYMEEDERREHGTFATAEDAIAACCRLVDQSLAHEYRPGMTAAQFFDRYILDQAVTATNVWRPPIDLAAGAPLMVKAVRRDTARRKRIKDDAPITASQERACGRKSYLGAAGHLR